MNVDGWTEEELERGLRVEQGVKEDDPSELWVKLTALNKHPSLPPGDHQSLALFGPRGDSLWRDLAEVFTDLAGP